MKKEVIRKIRIIFYMVGIWLFILSLCILFLQIGVDNRVDDLKNTIDYAYEHHLFYMYWDCNGTDEISSSCDDIINVQLNQGCVLKNIS